MARQFSIPSFLRQVPNPLLRRFFQKLGYEDLEIAWDALKKSEIVVIVQAINNLSPEQQDRVESAMRNVFDLAYEMGIDAFVEAATQCNQLDFAQLMPEDADPYSKAMWVWLNHPTVFDKALRIHQVEHLSWWRKRNDLPRKVPDIDPAAITRLEHEIGEAIRVEQGRGRVCTVEPWERDGTYYVFAYPDDFVQNVTAHDDHRKLVPRTHRQTFMIVFAYSSADGSLELHGKIPAKLKRKLEEVFANVALDFKLGPWNPDAAYELNQLANPAFDFRLDPEDQIRVHIRKMRICPKDSGRRVFLEIDDDDPDDTIHKQIDESLNKERLPRSAFWVNMVTFCFEFLPLDGRKPGRVSFDVGFPSSCSLRNQPPDRIRLIQKYLKRWKVDRVRVPEPDIAKAG